MKGGEKNNDFILGKIDGKLESILMTFTAHAVSDEKNFADLHAQLAKNTEDTTTSRVVMAKYVGGAVVLAAVISYLLPTLITRFFN